MKSNKRVSFGYEDTDSAIEVDFYGIVFEINDLDSIDKLKNLDEENEDVIEEFIKNNSSFNVEKFDFKKNEQLKDEKNANEFFQKYIKNCKYLQVYQNEKTDGFFICKMAKNG